MPETIKWNASELTGVTGMKAWLYGQLSGTLLNTSGDDLTETGSSSGLFTFSLAEARTGLGNLRAVIKSSGGITYRDGILREAATLVEDIDMAEVLDAAVAAGAGRWPRNRRAWHRLQWSRASRRRCFRRRRGGAGRKGKVRGAWRPQCSSPRRGCRRHS